MNVAIIGCGAMGALHAQMAANCGLTVVACADTIRRNAESVAKRFGAEATDDCMGIATSPDADIVAVTTPTPFHAPYVIAAANAGKNIFCEKPFTRTVAEARECIAAAKRAKVKLFIAHVVRYFQEFVAIKAQIDAGKVGKVGFVRTYRGGIFPRGENDWFRDYSQSGGVTLDCIIHDFDWVRYMFGDVDRVYCQSLQRSTPDVLDYSMTTLRFKSGAMAQVIGTWAHPSGFRVKVEVCGESGMIQYDSNEAPTHVNPRKQNASSPSMIVPSSPVPVSPYQLEWEDFLGWCEGRSKPRVTPEDGLASLRIALAALESAATGKAVKP